MNNKTLLWIIIAIIVIAFIILPTFTPEDLITTVPLFGIIGWKKFTIIAGITLLILSIALLIAYNRNDIKTQLKRINLI